MEDKNISDEETLEEIFRPGGILASRLPSYEYRSSQLAMARAVLRVIKERRHLCVEAGTGTGKTLAYLIPALFSRKRVVVSTATRNLQEQIFLKDLPFIRRHLFPKLSVTYMKGRQNYLCLQKFYSQDPQGLVPGAGQEDWEAISKWIDQTETGDRAELDWIGDNDPLWKTLDARSESCLGQRCPLFAKCFVTRMRQRAVESDIIIVNHALLFAHLALQSDEIGAVLPDFSVLILDEAHEVEDVACQHLGRQFSNYQVDEYCRDFQRIFAGDLDYDQQLARLEEKAATFFSGLPGTEGRYSLNFYRTPGHERLDLREELQDRFSGFQDACRVLYHELGRHQERPPESDALVRRLEEMWESLERIFVTDNGDEVFWFEKRGRGVFLHVNPIDVAPILRERLFGTADAVILTSATLATAGRFEYVKERLGVPDPDELILPVEFDYPNQALLYVPAAFPEPRSPGYFSRALREIMEILEISEGHAFLLFTSYQQMRRVYEALEEKSRFPLLCQGMRPKSQLLETFKTTPHAVLCATSSFWQGVDVQGDALRAVIIDKLPFLVPTEPIVAARINRLDNRGENSFMRYSVPEAIIALRQGLGRLIRSHQDRGIMAIFDSRLRTRQYGRFFLESLPNCPVTDNIDDLRNFFR